MPQVIVQDSLRFLKMKLLFDITKGRPDKSPISQYYNVSQTKHPADSQVEYSVMYKCLYAFTCAISNIGRDRRHVMLKKDMIPQMYLPIT